MAERSGHGSVSVVDTEVCIAGGGPAGIVGGLLLARAGVDVTVLEKHVDFNRDFRGDTVHPSTLELLAELGWLDEFLALPHSEMPRVNISSGGGSLVLADMTRLPTCCGFVAFVPQWEFLTFLAAKGTELPGFHLMRNAEAVAPVWDRTGEHGGGSYDGVPHPRVAGVDVSTSDGPQRIRAAAVVAADGRDSALRDAVRLPVVRGRAPMDVLWLRLPRRPGENLPLFTAGAAVLIAIDRGDYWQIAYTVPPDGLAEMKKAGIAGLRRGIAVDRPELADRVAELRDWDDVSELRVSVDHLQRWYVPGLLCIGDAAHAMSPAGGVGINVAIQDAVATANALAPIFVHCTTSKQRAGAQKTRVSATDLAALDRAMAAIQRRRAPAARITQGFQAAALRAMHPSADKDRTPPAFAVVRRVPALRHLAGRFIGLGVRPEHVKVPARHTRPDARRGCRS